MIDKRQRHDCELEPDYRRRFKCDQDGRRPCSTGLQLSLSATGAADADACQLLLSRQFIGWRGAMTGDASEDQSPPMSLTQSHTWMVAAADCRICHPTFGTSQLRADRIPLHFELAAKD